MILGESRGNHQRPIGEIEQSLAAGFSNNPVMSQHQYQQNPSVLRTQHYTYHKETITIQQPPHHITNPFHLPPLQIYQPPHYYHEEIVQQNIRIDPSYFPPPPPSSNNSILIPPTNQLRPYNISDDNSLENVERHDPLFYGVHAPEIPEEVVQREPDMFFGREERERDGEVYGLRIFEKTPWWVLMIVFLVCLLLFGVLITWMFQRKKKINVIEGVLERVSIGGGSAVKSPLVIPPVIPPVVVQKKETVVQPPLKQVKQQKTEVITPVETSPKQLAKEQKLIAKTVVNETPQPPAVVEQKVVKQQTSSPTAVVPVATQPPVLTKVVEKEETPTVIGLVCGKDSFSFNGKCYFCPSDQEWNGTNCVLKQAKHLKRWAGKREVSYDNLQTC